MLAAQVWPQDHFLYSQLSTTIVSNQCHGVERGTIGIYSIFRTPASLFCLTELPPSTLALTIPFSEHIVLDTQVNISYYWPFRLKFCDYIK